MNLNKIFQKAENFVLANKFSEAHDLFLKILKRYPSNLNALNSIALIKLKMGNRHEAIEYLQRSIMINENQLNIFSNLAICHFENNDTETAIQVINKGLLIFPNNPYLLFNRAYFFSNQKKYDQAIRDYVNLIEIDSLHEKAHQNLGIIFNSLGRFTESIDINQKLIEINPQSLEAHYNLAIVYEAKGELKKAEDFYKKSIELDNQNLKIYNNLANLYLKNNFQIEESLKICCKGLVISPTNFELNILRAQIHIFKKEYKEAEKLLRNLTLSDDENIKQHANFNLSTLLLYKENLSEGWNLYNSRFTLREKPNFALKIPECLDLDNSQNIILWGEQGVGDHVIFSSLIVDILDKKNLTVALDKRLIPLYERSFTNIRLISLDDKIDPKKYDFQLPLIGLGKFLRTKKEDFKKQKSFFLVPDKDKSDKFKKQIFSKGKLSCGISWRSNNLQFGFGKSLRLNDFLPLLKNNKFNFVDLQYGETKEEIYPIKHDFGITINNIEGLDKFNDLDSLFALIDACDFVVTCSNVTAHFAGSIGKKTFLLLPYYSHFLWYWEESNKSKWYPSIEVLKQEKQGEWANEMQKINSSF